MPGRKANHKILDLILKRHSPRAMSGESISHDELMQLFEAARWAPSSYNNQPWRFIYAHRDTPAWNKLFDLMVPFNQSWTKNAAVLLLVASAKSFGYNGTLSRTHSFDTGAAVENMALQAASMGLVFHGMEGFDYDRARTALNIPNDFDIEALFAIGCPGNREKLSKELQEREVLSDRKPVETFIFEGGIK